MGITVKFYGDTKPGPGVKPIRVVDNPKLPFGKAHPVDWMTGKHLSLKPGESPSPGNGGLTINQFGAIQNLINSLTENNSFLSQLLNNSDILKSFYNYDMTGLESGQVLFWTGESWVGIDFALRELNDVKIKDSPPVDGDVLAYSEAEGGWVAGQVNSGMPVDPDSYNTLGGPSEGSETASNDTWVAGGVTGLKEYYVSRVVYIETGDKKIYAFIRCRTYDGYGRLYSVSGETRVEVDAAVEI
jgi:hypothetical protein